jgi:thymidylate synthase (FAD)
MYIKSMEESQKTYNGLVEILIKEHVSRMIGEGMEESKAKRAAEKMAIEDARYVFPNACETKIVVTMNARSLLNFFRHRCCSRAQWEIRELADKMLCEVKGVAPVIFKKAGPPCLAGPCHEGAMSCGKIEEMRVKYNKIV